MRKYNQNRFRKFSLNKPSISRHNVKVAAMFFGVFLLCSFISGCQPIRYVSANHIASEPKATSGGLGITYKQTNKPKAGAALSGALVTNKKNRKPGKYFHVFERSKKKVNPDLSLFPAGVSNKFRLKDRHTNARKAARLLKKTEKNKGKVKKEG